MKKPIPGPVFYRLLVQWFEWVFCMITKRQDQIDIHSDSIAAKKITLINSDIWDLEITLKKSLYWNFGWFFFEQINLDILQSLTSN